MKNVPPRKSLEWRLPLMNGALLLVVIGVLSAASYLAVRQTTISAATSRLQAVTQQLAGMVRTSALNSLVTLRAVGQKEPILEYLRRPDSGPRAAALEALQYRGNNPDQMLAVELRDPQGRRLLAWGPGTSRITDVDETDVLRAIGRRDSGSVGAYRSLGDSVVYPMWGIVTDRGRTLGYVVQWRKQSSTPAGRQIVSDLIGAGSGLLLGDSSQTYWNDLVARVPGPPLALPLGTDISRPKVVRYERDGRTHYGAAALARGTPWVALVEFSDNVVLQPLEAFLRRLLAIASGLVVLALVAAWLMSRSVTRPLRDLAAAAEAFSAGDHARRVEINRDDELGRLATAFNHFVEGVRDTHHSGEERFQLLVQSVKDYAIFALDIEGRVVTWNAGAERLKGYQGAEIIGRHFSTFYGPEDLENGKPARELEEAANEGRVEDEGWRIRKDGSRFWANVVITALRDRAGELVGYAKVTRDMSERRMAEEALRQRGEDLDRALTQLRDAQEMLVRREKLAILGQLASGVGHELRNPLGVMTNAVYYLEAVLPDAAPNVREYVGILRAQIDLSEKIVSDLLDFARVKPPQRGPVPLAEVVERQIKRVGRMDGVNLRVEVPQSLPPALADQVQVGQVVLNLLTNAVQAMGEEGGTLTVRAESDSTGTLRLVVSDDGRGISEENMGKIFEPLFTTKARGMGLGLAVSRALAIANGGDIMVESREGEGATFTLILPVADLGKAA